MRRKINLIYILATSNYILFFGFSTPARNFPSFLVVWAGDVWFAWFKENYFTFLQFQVLCRTPLYFYSIWRVIFRRKSKFTYVWRNAITPQAIVAQTLSQSIDSDLNFTILMLTPSPKDTTCTAERTVRHLLSKRWKLTLLSSCAISPNAHFLYHFRYESGLLCVSINKSCKKKVWFNM